MTEAKQVTLSFSCEFDERVAWEIELKGWFEHAVVHLPEGGIVHISFWDPVRLAQDLETDLQAGKRCLAEPGMIVIPKLTVENMKAAVEELYHSGYFDRLRSAFQ